MNIHVWLIELILLVHHLTSCGNAVSVITLDLHCTDLYSWKITETAQ